MQSFPHKPLREGDLDDEFIQYVCKLYNEDDLREDNYKDVAKQLNEYVHRNRDRPQIVESVRQLYKAVSSMNINVNDSDSDNDTK